ncbi:hypothetical protein EHS25_007166 [Saitozyma podzolica]|uniref:Uncharacterized protein n=1 Tax=Saitozyma podzolica TaxID=1890683 RepID=A0A427XPC6_9TREE|nr:hypothetical protein EHS25_007166 [Saitozyma podzolica]
MPVRAPALAYLYAVRNSPIHPKPAICHPSLPVLFSSFVLRGVLGGPRPAESLLDRFLSLVDLITVHKPLAGLPAGVSARCAEPLAEAFVADPGDDTPFSILAFPKAGLALGLEMERYPHVDWTSPKTGWHNTAGYNGHQGCGEGTAGERCQAACGDSRGGHSGQRGITGITALQNKRTWWGPQTRLPRPGPSLW